MPKFTSRQISKASSLLDHQGLLLIQWKLQVIFWNSLGTISTLKLPWHVFLPVLLPSAFYSSIDFNGLQLQYLVSESLELCLYRAQTTRSLEQFFSPLRLLKHCFSHWSIILIELNLETFRYLSNHLQFHCCLMSFSLWISCDTWQLHSAVCHPTLMFWKLRTASICSLVTR